MSAPNVIVIGAGPNGLTAASLLAKSGRNVLLVERSGTVGGLAASHEFHPGYRSAGLLNDTTALRPSVVEQLELAKHGLVLRDRPRTILACGSEGRSLLLHGEAGQAARAIGDHSQADAGRYVEYRAFIEGIGDLLRSFIDEPPLDLLDLPANRPWDLIRRGFGLRRLGRKRMMELLRLPPMCVADWLNEWFESEPLKAALALPAIAGTFMGPRSPGSNLNLLLHETSATPGARGGGAALISALKNAATAQGVEIRTSADVRRILTDSAGVCGVELSDGERIDCRTIAASCDPKQTLLRLMPAGALTHRLRHRIETYRTRGTTAQVLLALGGPVRFGACPDEPIEYCRIAPDLVALERAFDAVKYRTIADEPACEVHVASASDPGLAPSGHAVVSVLVHFVPYDTNPEWDDSTRTQLGNVVVGLLDRHAPGVRDNVIASRVLGPRDIEAHYATSGGHIHHGEHGLDQLLVRPAPECVGYRSPIPGLFLCGSGSHPGGGLTCAPGRLAVRSIAVRP